MVGSLEIIYESFKNFCQTYLQPYVNQSSLMYPKVYFPGNAGGPLQSPNAQSYIDDPWYSVGVVINNDHAFVSDF